ncbi:winged helix-turn-helix transcriptional regulator [Gilliamella sp. B2889]|nr:winged helix-turn-helix transcriptional regulator [Gilliamella sp. B2889]
MEYTLTDVGQSLKQVHDAMLAWGSAYKSKQSANK